jgi:hypothetical protein
VKRRREEEEEEEEKKKRKVGKGSVLRDTGRSEVAPSSGPDKEEGAIHLEILPLIMTSSPSTE